MIFDTKYDMIYYMIFDVIYDMLLGVAFEPAVRRKS